MFLAAIAPVLGIVELDRGVVQQSKSAGAASATNLFRLQQTRILTRVETPLRFSLVFLCSSLASLCVELSAAAINLLTPRTLRKEEKAEDAG